MSEHARREHLVRLLQDLAVRGERVDLRRAWTALGLASVGPLLVSAVRDLHVQATRLAGADAAGNALAALGAVYSVGPSPAAPWEPVFVDQGRVEGAFEDGDPTVLLAAEITDGKEQLSAIEVLRSAGLRPTGVVAVLDREKGGADRILCEAPFSCLVSLKELIG